MINFLFTLFSKDYCPYYPIKDSVIREFVLPYENILYGSFVKGNFYIRRQTITFKYKNPLLGTFVKSKYSGLLYLNIEDQFGNKEEKNIILIPNYFEDDDDFLSHAYSKYDPNE